MKTFKIVDDDIVLDAQNNIEMVEGTEELMQSIERGLTTNTEEWFLNLEFGLDHRAVRGKGKGLEDIKLEIMETIYQDERIQAIDITNIEVDSNRSLIIEGMVTDIEGVGIPLQEVVEFE